jgi:NAD(P)-dependent dehydrogenase (short-subunit alcohol dehydrogenase family)
MNTTMNGGQAMANHVALITGGAKGIGRGIALDLASRQWNIAFCYRTSEIEAKTTAKDIAQRGGQRWRFDVTFPIPRRPSTWLHRLKKNGGESMS